MKQIAYMLYNIAYCLIYEIIYVERCGVEVWSTFGRRLIEVWSKFGRSMVPQFGRHLITFIMYFIDIPSKLRPNFDTGGVEVWSKFGRSLVEVWSKFGRSLVEVWSKFGRSLVEVWSKFRHVGCRSLAEVSTKLRPPPQCRSLV